MQRLIEGNRVVDQPQRAVVTDTATGTARGSVGSDRHTFQSGGSPGDIRNRSTIAGGGIVVERAVENGHRRGVENCATGRRRRISGDRRAIDGHRSGVDDRTARVLRGVVANFGIEDRQRSCVPDGTAVFTAQDTAPLQGDSLQCQRGTRHDLEESVARGRWQTAGVDDRLADALAANDQTVEATNVEIARHGVVLLHATQRQHVSADTQLDHIVTRQSIRFLNGGSQRNLEAG